MGHNIKTFDTRVLFNAAAACDMVEQLAGSICGFLDTLPLFRAEYVGVVKRFSQVALVSHFLGECYDAHDARADASTLRKLVQHCGISPATKLKFTFSTLYVQHSLWYERQKRGNLESLARLVDAQVLSQGVAARLAGSGLTYHHLSEAHLNGGESALHGLLTRSAAWDIKSGVTTSRKILDNLVHYLENC